MTPEEIAEWRGRVEARLKAIDLRVARLDTNGMEGRISQQIDTLHHRINALAARHAWLLGATTVVGAIAGIALGAWLHAAIGG